MLNLIKPPITDQQVSDLGLSAKIVNITSNFDFLTVGATDIYTVPAGKTFLVDGMYHEHLVASGSITSYAFEVQDKVVTANKYLPLGTISSVGVGRLISINASSTTPGSRYVAQSGDTLQLRISASTHTSGVLTGKVYLRGYLVNN